MSEAVFEIDAVKLMRDIRNSHHARYYKKQSDRRKKLDAIRRKFEAELAERRHTSEPATEKTEANRRASR